MHNSDSEFNRRIILTDEVRYYLIAIELISKIVASGVRKTEDLLLKSLSILDV